MRPRNPANRDLPPRMIRRVRTLKSGEKWVGYYYAGRDAEGKRVETPLGTDIDDARTLWAKLERKTVPVSTRTVGDLLRRYDRDVVPGKAPKTQKENRKCMLHLHKAFEKAPMDSITPQIIAQYRDARTAPVRANREIALLSHAFNMAREWGIYSKDNPTRGVRRNKEAPRDIYVTDEVWKALYDEAADDLKVAMDLAYLTGQRPADVRKMRWSEVDADYLMVDQGKTSMKLRIRLHQGGVLTGLGILLATLDRSRPHLITTSKGKQMSESMLRTRFEPARKRAADKAEKNGDPDLAASIMKFQFRDIRPKAASEILSLEDASDLLGHTTQGMTQRVYRRVGKVVNPSK
ncbi:tyrosine-type recombinase/integrase [Pseudomonas syringae]|uniref:Integrase n=1 Tax=Pseudomonas syringae TaxID=317 RepID=A0A085V6N5_PSESX|nr:tyrosine-type recombinase/integrase [Pseudomonas syringae]KFE51098.1 integrase [Pseudomonas syringae]